VSRDALDVLFSTGDLILNLLFSVQMEPGLVVKGVVANLVPSSGDGGKGLSVLVEHGVLTDDEKGNGQITLLEKM